VSPSSTSQRSTFPSSMEIESCGSVTAIMRAPACARPPRPRPLRSGRRP
jgi:hypothetical protein